MSSLTTKAIPQERSTTAHPSLKMKGDALAHEQPESMILYQMEPQENFRLMLSFLVRSTK